MRAFLLFACCLALCACKERDGTTKKIDQEAPAPVASADSPRAAPKLVRSQPLTTEARMALRAQMLEHGDDMENLLWSALMLDYEGTEGIADKMSKAPTLSRAGVGQEDTINALLPPEFFQHQDELQASLARLQLAASAKKDEAMAEEYASLSKTCIQCHSLYLRFPAGGEN